MAGRLVTIATFDLPAKARVAQNVLEEAGVKAVVTDEATVTMDWLLGNAIGWVKVQVMEEDAERAVAALEESLGTGDPVDAEALAAEAEAATPEEDVEPPAPEAAQVAGSARSPDGAEPEPSERDEYARRLLLAAIFALVLAPFWFYAVYLFLNAAFGEGSLSPRGRTKLLVSGLLLVVGSFMAYFFVIYALPSL